MDGESGESMEEDEVKGAGRKESEQETMTR